MDRMSEFEQRLEAIQNRLDVAIQANLAKYKNLDFSQQTLEANQALNQLKQAMVDFCNNRIGEQEVKPFFLNWIRAMKCEPEDSLIQEKVVLPSAHLKEITNGIR
jgi:hypothetical protein